jgi:hypothetical protein
VHPYKVRALFLLGLGSTLFNPAYGQQFGPVFPTHRFPTDSSFHLSYGAHWATHSSNFISPSFTDVLQNNAKLSIFSHEFTGEIQPNRSVSLGAILRVDSLSLQSGSQELAKKTGLGDQRFFAEYRFFDVVGMSVGLMLMGKIPAYSNPSLAELSEDGKTSTVFLGDGQSDFGVGLSGELWPSETLRFRLNSGVQLRLESYPLQLPFLVSIAFVTPKLDFELRAVGSTNLGGQSEDTLEELRNLAGGSKYALASRPWNFSLWPSVELWLGLSWALRVDYRISLTGQDSANYQRIGLGFVYRWAERRRVRPKTFQQVDIRTDHEAGVFQGEKQLEALEPKPKPQQPITEESSSDPEFN